MRSCCPSTARADARSGGSRWWRRHGWAAVGIGIGVILLPWQRHGLARRRGRRTRGRLAGLCMRLQNRQGEEKVSACHERIMTGKRGVDDKKRKTRDESKSGGPIPAESYMPVRLQLEDWRPPVSLLPPVLVSTARQRGERGHGPKRSGKQRLPPLLPNAPAVAVRPLEP